MGDAELEGDYVLEAAGSSDCVPFRAERGSSHFLWVYQELFTRMRVSFPFSDFQRDVLTRCKVAVSQLHLNGWGFLQTFERVCLYFGFRPIAHLFLYIYDVLIPPSRKGYVSFRAHQGRRLFASYEESIQEFKWHYFKVLPSPGKRAFWLDDKGFFLSILEFRDDLLLVKMKQNKLDRLMTMLADPTKLAKKGPSKRERPPVVNVDGEEGVKEDPSADLRQKRRRKGGKDKDVVDHVLGEDAAWEHEPLKTMPPEQLLGESWRLSCQSVACLQIFILALLMQVGLESALAAKTKAEQELLAAQDQLSVKEGERQSDLERVPRLKDDIKVLQTELKSCRSSLEQEQKRAEVAENKDVELSSSLHKSQLDLGAANEMSTY
ncbi:hypothetical protein PIB30_008051 [Stylosanthes scabra]|uniref:Transposase (Putative), gypsy type n=1 Tax=Stylosanthes scabra TaxID=79078 RepID=A0ABU6W5F1_9FABA|nr:hypothetical protein [Stylosanthes scabra]